MKKNPHLEVNVKESEITWIGEDTHLDGNLTFSETTRVFGTLMGQIRAKTGSTLILMETSVVEGSLDVDTLIIGGFVRGDIRARGRIVILGTGRVIGNIIAQKLQIDFGAYFEGECEMQNTRGTTDAPSISL